MNAIFEAPSTPSLTSAYITLCIMMMMHHDTFMHLVGLLRDGRLQCTRPQRRPQYQGRPRCSRNTFRLLLW